MAIPPPQLTDATVRRAKFHAQMLLAAVRGSIPMAGEGFTYSGIIEDVDDQGRTHKTRIAVRWPTAGEQVYAGALVRVDNSTSGGLTNALLAALAVELGSEVKGPEIPIPVKPATS